MATPPDLDEFWGATLDAARKESRAPQAEPVDHGLRMVNTMDVTFSGFDGQRVRAWLHRPADTQADLPTIVRFQGYGGGRGLSHQVSHLVLAGYALLDVDTRGQGSGWSPGDTEDPVGSGPAHPGYLTRGVLHQETYYYRRVFTDAVLAVDAILEFPGVDPGGVVVAGGSQGGGIALATAALSPHVSGLLCDVPFLSDFRRATEIAATAPYSELITYLAVHRDKTDRVFSTLAYFDGSVLATRAEASALFSVALMDELCPPSTVYAAFNTYAGEKQMCVYPYNNHEGGGVHHEVTQLNWLLEKFPPTSSPSK